MAYINNCFVTIHISAGFFFPSPLVCETRLPSAFPPSATPPCLLHTQWRENSLYLSLPFSLSLFSFLLLSISFSYGHIFIVDFTTFAWTRHTQAKRRRRRTTGVVATVKMLGLDIYVFFLFCFSFGHNKRDGTTQPKQKYNRIWEWKWDV